MTMTIKTGILLAAGVLSLSACGSQNNANNQSAPATTAAMPAGATPAGASPADADAKRSALVAAAEPFETLTEQAQTANPTTLAKLMSDARTAAAGVAGKLSSEQQKALDGRLAEIAGAAKTNDRTGVAIASVEGYRLLVESAQDTGPVPRAVSLLDYSGFRYQADLAAKPTRWADMSAALDFADGQWSGIQARITDTALRDEFAKSLTEMRKAVNAKDMAAAKKASTTELNLVDRLEKFFNTKH